MNETDKIGSCPNESKHSGRNARSHNPSKGGRCLINCIGGSKIWMHNAVVSALAKRINGKGFVATPQASTIHQTVRKQADITVIRQTDVSKPLYVDVTVVQHESNLKSAPRLARLHKQTSKRPMYASMLSFRVRRLSANAMNSLNLR